MVKASLKGKRKKWFGVKAKNPYKGVDLGEILAYEIKNIIGRKLTVNYSQIANNSKDQKTKVKFEITETKGEDGLAEPIGMFVQDSFIGQRIKRDSTRNILVFNCKSKDKKDIKIKAIYSSKNKISKSVNARILKNLQELFTEFVGSIESNKLFDIEFMKKKTYELKKKSNNVYPIDKLYLWKLSII